MTETCVKLYKSFECNICKYANISEINHKVNCF